MTRWNLELSVFNFEIEHGAGRDHCNADGLSRITMKCPRENCPDCKQLRGKPLPGRKPRVADKNELESDGNDGDAVFDYCVEATPHENAGEPPQ